MDWNSQPSAPGEDERMRLGRSLLPNRQGGRAYVLLDNSHIFHLNDFTKEQLFLISFMPKSK